MSHITIGRPEFGRPVANQHAKRVFGGEQFPLNVKVSNRLTVALSLPEAGIKLDPMASAITKFSDFDRLQRTVSSLEQIARLNDVPEAAVLALEVEPESETDEGSESGAGDGAESQDGSDSQGEQGADTAEGEQDAGGASDPSIMTATIVQDNEEAFVVEMDGVQFEPQRNQVRDDNSLTNGGIAAFEEAKAAAGKAE